jgi:hypothetical protein
MGDSNRVVRRKYLSGGPKLSNFSLPPELTLVLAALLAGKKALADAKHIGL